MTEAEALQRVTNMYDNLVGAKHKSLRMDREALAKVLEMAKRVRA